jgi:hypothetical protein
MKLLAIALALLVLASSCMAINKKKLVYQMSENQKQEQGMERDHELIDSKNHHQIPTPPSQKDFGKPGGSSHFGVNDDNDHHYIPRKDYGTHPGNA